MTEGKAKPDFLFPGMAFYHDMTFPAELLTMLAAKSTCKDRWRQLLAEADRIEEKHLLTLEPSISIAQTDEMRQRKVQLVVPVGLHQTYTVAQRNGLMSISGMVAFIRERQVSAGL
jgi:hypothetical protein